MGAISGSSGDKGASAGAKKKQAGVGINRKAKVEAYVSKLSVGGAEPNPDDALAPRNPEDGVVPDLSTALAAAKRAVAMAAVDAANASSDAPVTFEQWVISLPKKEQENITESYLHYTAAQDLLREWKSESEHVDYSFNAEWPGSRLTCNEKHLKNLAVAYVFTALATLGGKIDQGISPGSVLRQLVKPSVGFYVSTGELALGTNGQR